MSRRGITFPTSRRSFLKGASAGLAASVLATPFISRGYAQSRPLRISNFGGFFEQAFATGVYPAFSEATGIPVQSLAQPSGEQFLVQLAQAVRANAAPMDIACAGQVELVRGRQQGLWKKIETGELSNLPNMPEQFMFQSDDGLDGVGAMGWYITFVANPLRAQPLPTRWADMWDRDRESGWGVQAGGGSTILEITADTFFDGPETLTTIEGIDAVMEKIAELRDTTALWWTDEGTMQSAFQNGDVLGGMYYHDTAMIMRGEGTEIESIFPEEGAIQGFNGWCVPASNEMTDEIKAFLDWSVTPEAHELIARNVMAAPLLPRDMLNLTEEEFALVSTDGPSILFNAAVKVEHASHLSQAFLNVTR